MKAMRLLVVSDSPVLNTGFGTVVKNLVPRWRGAFERIDIWGIGASGEPEDWPERIYPAAIGGDLAWASKVNLARLADRIVRGGYTHVWMMADHFLLAQHSFPQVIRMLREKMGIRFIYYVPVDAPLEKAWVDPIRAVDLAVPYTEYGAIEILRAGGLPHVGLSNPIPHGVCDLFKPYPTEQRNGIRDRYGKAFFKEFDSDRDVLLVNVNQHNKRKGLAQALGVVKEAKRISVEMGKQPESGRIRLLFHSSVRHPFDGTDLAGIAEQLGLEHGVDWAHTDHKAETGERVWNGLGPRLDVGSLVDLYNSADATITTTLGEGWGLSIVESAACGTPVFLPSHTACGHVSHQIGQSGMVGIWPLPASSIPVVLPADNNRVRYPVDVPAAALKVARMIQHGEIRRRLTVTEEFRERFSWDRIAARWIGVFSSLEVAAK